MFQSAAETCGISSGPIRQAVLGPFGTCKKFQSEAESRLGSGMGRPRTASKAVLRQLEHREVPTAFEDDSPHTIGRGTSGSVVNWNLERFQPMVHDIVIGPTHSKLTRIPFALPPEA